MNALPEGDEFCPRCGHWTIRLNRYTGWCVTCSQAVAAANKRAYRAAHSKKERERDKERRQQFGTGECAHCGRMLYLRVNGTVNRHPVKRQVGGPPCPGSGQHPAEKEQVA